MSGMHLLPVYYSTTNTRKRKQKKKSKSVLEAERKHAKFLKKMGVGSRSSAGKSNGKLLNRSLAQSGSAPALGAGGQKFESSTPTNSIIPVWQRNQRMFTLVQKS